VQLMRYDALSLFVAALIALSATGLSAKTASHMVTAQMRANAQANIERYEWAADERERVVRAAQPYIEMSEEELWRMLPSQYVPRNCGVHKTAGCPNCGDEILNVKEPQMYMRYAYDREAHPWKLRCKNCDTLFPSNDFGAYYRSGLDDRGEFQRELADESLLLNPDHPDPNDPEHKKWVDDGYGLESEGETLTIIAHYTYYLWREARQAAEDLARAWALTGDPIYAHKCAIMLDRFADVYPNMDYEGFVAANGWVISDGGSNKGMILGRIWETSTASKLSWAYDVIYEQMLEDEALVDFAARMRAQYPGLDQKPDTDAIARHIEDNLITLFCEAVTEQRIRGNIGATERAMAMSAIALDRPELTERYLDWLFEGSYRPIPEVLVNLVSRDGPSYEAAPGYSLSPRSLVPVADLLRQYDGYTKHDLYGDFPKMKQIFLAPAAFRCLNEVTPRLGDSGKVGGYGDIRHAVDMMLSGFRAYGTEDIARELWHSARYEDARLERSLDIFDEDPMAVVEDLQALKPELPIRLESENRSGYGLAVQQTRWQENGRCVYTSYGRTAGSHPHNDRLHIGIFAKGFVMMPDLAYPEYTGGWPKRHAWTNHTVSHNTVMVNDAKQNTNWSGKTEVFFGGDTARLAIIDGLPTGPRAEGLRGPVYDIDTYKRATSLIDVSETDSYVFDVFWVRGGSNHRMINNGSSREIAHSNLALTEQPTGTFAGPDVDYAQFYDDDPGSGYRGTGFQYLRDVQRGTMTADSAWVDWDVVHARTGQVDEGRDPHLRMHMLSEVDEVATAIGEPPHHRYHDDYLPYVLRSRLGDDLQSQFVTVLEPYEPEPFIASTRPLPIDAHDGEGFACAVEVTLTDGRVDILLLGEQPGRINAGGVTLEGQMGFVRMLDGEVIDAKLFRGTRLSVGDWELTSPLAETTGTVADVNTDDWRDNLIVLDESALQAGLTAEDLVGRHIVVENEARSDACYLIRDLREDGTVISTADETLIERLVDVRDLSAGYVTTVKPGERFRIPLSASMR
ncbi:MAG: hypothetical protein GF393_11230, partial [Armatimonadia bacterium]|nr:hypothetical protein [Armatimonadia bacterium]